MSDAPPRFERQSEWQRSRTALSWSEKIRIVDEMREDIEALRRRREPTGPVSGAGNPGGLRRPTHSPD